MNNEKVLKRVEAKLMRKTRSTMTRDEGGEKKDTKTLQ